LSSVTKSGSRKPREVYGDVCVTIDEDVSSALANDAVVVFSVSGGKDSLVSAHATMAYLDSIGHPRSLRYAIHADLGRAEWKTTPETVAEQCRVLGLRLIVVKRRMGDMVQMWEQRFDDGLVLYRDLKLIIHRGPWSSSNQRFCTAGQKRDVIVQELASRFPGRTVISVIGVRRAESTGRRSTPVSSWEKKMHRATGTRGLNWNPLVTVSTQAVYDYAAAHALPMHEAYGVWGSTRLSCALCVLASRGDLQSSLRNPDNLPLFRLLVDIEARTGFSFQQKSWLADQRADLLDAGMARRLTSAKSYAEERRQAEAAICRSFLEGSKDDPWPRRLPEREEADAIAIARNIVAKWLDKEMPHLTGDSVTRRMAAMIAGRAPNTTP
jgi:3'-phosphoadenosine 5'-phosphosulfate sulfotransferase (PAPS reductase)/FAD synthetase